MLLLGKRWRGAPVSLMRRESACQFPHGRSGSEAPVRFAASNGCNPSEADRRRHQIDCSHRPSFRRTSPLVDHADSRLMSECGNAQGCRHASPRFLSIRATSCITRVKQTTQIEGDAPAARVTHPAREACGSSR